MFNESLKIEDQLHRNYFPSQPKKDNTSRKLIGVEVDLFSYQIPETQFEQVLNSVCGEQFSIDLLKECSDGTYSFFITPKDYYLVDGGMMYTSAASILKQLAETGLLVQEFRTIRLN